MENTGFSIDKDKGKLFGQHLLEASEENPLLLLGADSIGTYERLTPSAIRPDIRVQLDSGDATLDAARLAFKHSGNLSKRTKLIQGFANSHSKAETARFKREVIKLEKKHKEWANRMDAVRQTESPLRVALEARKIHIESLREFGGPEDIKLARKLELQEPTLIVNRGIVPAETQDAFDFSSYKYGNIHPIQKTKGVHEYEIKLSSGGRRKINENLDPKDMHDFSMTTWLEMVEATNAVMNRLLRSKTTVVASAKPSWSQLDAMIEYEKRGGKVDWKTQAKLQNTEEAQLASLKLKAVLVKKGKRIAALGYWDRLKLNLPLPTALERIYDPAADALRSVLDAAEKGATLQQLKDLRKQMLDVHGFKLENVVPSLDGDMYKFNISKYENRWMETPVVMYDTVPAQPVFNPQTLVDQIAEVKAERFNHLVSNPSQDEMLPHFTMALVQSPEFMKSLTVRGLADDQVTGLGNFGSQLTGEALTREFRYRDSEYMLAALRIREYANRISDTYLRELVQKNMGDVIPRLNAAPAAKSKVLVNQFISNTAGWDLEAAPTLVANNMWGFTLMDSMRNANRLGRAVKQGETLVNPRTGAEIVLDDLGLEFMSRYNQMTEIIRLDRNRVRAALNLDLVNKKNWYVPPAWTKNKYVAFVFDENRKPIPGRAIIGETQAHFAKLLSDAREEIAKSGKNEKIWTREEVETTADIYSMAQMDWIDPGTGVAPARGQTGALAAETINQYAVTDAMDWVKRSIESNANGAIRILYDAPLGIARARAGVERVGLDSKGRNLVRTIWDEYEATIMGRKLGDTDRSLTGKVTRGPEQFIDRGLEYVWPAMTKLGSTQWSQWYGNLRDLMGVKGGGKARTFAQLAQELGPHTPYKDAVDFAEQTLKIARPPEIKKIAEKLNWLAASTLLRWFEIPHAAMNLIGIMTTMPSVLQSGRAPVTAFMGTGKKRLPIIDTFKILSMGVHDMMSAAKRADREYAAKYAYTEQQVAEYNDLIGSIQDRGTFNKIMFGDKSRVGTSMRDRAAREGIDGLISLASSTTETWSRTYSHLVGLRLADMSGVVGIDARHHFAHEIANAAIANYNPLNRPELYNSAFGSMFGLFLSWTQSYNQRLFRWLEEGDYRSVGKQLGMQAALFGAASLPGYNQLESLLMATGVSDTVEGREATLMDRIYARFGSQMGSMIAHGGLNQFNIVLYTRADMNYRNVNFDPSQLLAGLSVTTSAINGVWEAGQSLLATSGLEDANRLGEIFARNMPNRALKGVLSVTLNGNRDIDANGRIISENRSFFESGLRILGLRSSRQQAEIEAFYADKQQQAREAARSEALREDTRNLIRRGPGWEKSLPEIFEKYRRLGFRPEHFRTWIQSQLREAGGTRGANELQKALRNPMMQQSVWRYNVYGAN